jgi:hypothetical protein
MTRMGSIAGTACAAALVVALGGCAAASGALDRAYAEATADHGGTRVTVAFSDGDRQAIRAYFAARSNGRSGKSHGHGHDPHGDFEALPPGLQKQVRKNGTLPPGLARERLPGDLERRLSPLPDGYVRVRIGTDIVLMDARTEIVLDLIRDLG